jgi:hypothetical protein
MMGRTREAEEEGRRGTEGANHELHLDFCAGAYARWVARTTRTKSERMVACNRLDLLMRRLQDYDALDQADILNARCWLESRDGTVPQERLEDLLRHLAVLPVAVAEQLRRMGMLDFC